MQISGAPKGQVVLHQTCFYTEKKIPTKKRSNLFFLLWPPECCDCGDKKHQVILLRNISKSIWRFGYFVFLGGSGMETSKIMYLYQFLFLYLRVMMSMIKNVFNYSNIILDLNCPELYVIVKIPHCLCIFILGGFSHVVKCSVSSRLFHFITFFWGQDRFLGGILFLFNFGTNTTCFPQFVGCLFDTSCTIVPNSTWEKYGHTVLILYRLFVKIWPDSSSWIDSQIKYIICMLERFYLSSKDSNVAKKEVICMYLCG